MDTPRDYAWGDTPREASRFTDRMYMGEPFRIGAKELISRRTRPAWANNVQWVYKGILFNSGKGINY
jgi:hypothetical protein